jgi:hypothetical protein
MVRASRRLARPGEDIPVPRAFAPQASMAPGSSQPGPFVEHVTEGAPRCLRRYIGSPTLPFH